MMLFQQDGNHQVAWRGRRHGKGGAECEKLASWQKDYTSMVYPKTQGRKAPDMGTSLRRAQGFHEFTRS